MTALGDARVSECRVEEFVLGGVAYLAARFDVEVVTAGAIQLAALMDAIAARVPTALTKRVYAWPTPEASPPCAVVGYPDEPIEFDTTFGRGGDQATIPLFVLVGKTSERTARDVLSGVLTGATGIKDAIDGVLTTA